LALSSDSEKQVLTLKFMTNM